MYNKEYHRQYYITNKRRWREYYRQNIEWYRKYWKKTRVKQMEYHKTWIKNNPEKALQIERNYLKRISIFKDKAGIKWLLKMWSNCIRKRDNNQCQICGSEEGIMSHHIFYKSKYPGLSLNLNNGIVLCKIHHKELHKLNV